MSTSRTPRAAVLGLTVGTLVAGGLALAPTASAASPDVVINEVYGGGGNSGATFTNDFVELRNNGTAAVDVSGWSVQYASAAGSSWAVTNLTGSIAPGGSYLVQQGAGAGGTTPLPTPDASGNIAMSGTAGKVALVTTTTALTCSTGCVPSATIRDFVGFGTTASSFEGAGRTPAPSNTNSVSRDAVGTDTDNNNLDFTAGTPTPQNSNPVEPEPQCEAEGTIAIGRVQGEGTATPCTGETVTVEGIVVGDLQDGGYNGFFVQDAGDGNAATSDGLFVYAPGGAQVVPGDRVTVTGTAGEGFEVTQLSDAAYSVTGSGSLPAATPLPLPSTDEQREALEAMLVEPTEALTVTEVFNLSNFGELLLAQGGRLISPTEAAKPGPASTAVAQQNDLRSIVLDDGRTTDLSPEDAPLLEPPYLTLNDPVRVGDTAVLEPVVLHYGFGAYRLQPSDGTADGMTFTATNPRPETPAAVGGDLKIADFNVLNYFVTYGPTSRGAPNEAEKEQQEAKIVSAMLDLDADIFTLHEIENSTVTTPDDPYRAVRTLVEALEERGGGEWNWVEAAEDTDVITNAIIYRPDRVSAVGAPVTPTSPEATAAFSNARTPIGQTFEKNGETFTVITNHFKSKGSGCAAADNDTSFGGAGNCNGNRVRQSEALRDFAAQIATDIDPDVLLTGDFNSYRYEDPIDVLRDAGYVDMGPLLAEGQYSYVFDGGSGSLDHVLATPSLAEKIAGLTVWDINSVESFAYEYGGYEPLYAPYEYRASDHNPTLIGLTAPAPDVPATATISDADPRRGDTVTLTGTAFDAGTTVRATLPSQGGALLGTGVADANGTVSIQFTVPDLVHKGSYQVDLTAADGEQASTSFTLRTRGQDVADRAHERNNGGR